MHRACCLLLMGLTGSTATLFPSRPGSASDVPPHLYEQFVGNALAGETLSAFQWVTTASYPDAKAAGLAANYLSRFVHRSEAETAGSDDPIIAAAVETYREYWRTVLMSDLPTAQAEAVLERRIRRLLTAHALAPEAGEDFTDALQHAIEQRGYHATTGRTLPYLELMIWKDVEETSFAVELTDREVTVAVTFIGGFISRGWVNFATLGIASSGGWAQQDRLVCVKVDYDVGSEKFLVHYLKHEARHFADYQQYPKLKPHDLEYRAKLTELIYSESTLRSTLARFVADARADVASAHSYAAFVLVGNLARRLLDSGPPVNESAFSAVSDEALKDAAAALLEEYDRSAKRRGRDDLESLIL